MRAGNRSALAGHACAHLHNGHVLLQGKALDEPLRGQHSKQQLNLRKHAKGRGEEGGGAGSERLCVFRLAREAQHAGPHARHALRPTGTR